MQFECVKWGYDSFLSFSSHMQHKNTINRQCSIVWGPYFKSSRNKTKAKANFSTTTSTILWKMLLVKFQSQWGACVNSVGMMNCLVWGKVFPPDIFMEFKTRVVIKKPEQVWVMNRDAILQVGPWYLPQLQVVPRLQR